MVAVLAAVLTGGGDGVGVVCWWAGIEATVRGTDDEEHLWGLALLAGGAVCTCLAAS